MMSMGIVIPPYIWAAFWTQLCIVIVAAGGALAAYLQTLHNRYEIRQKPSTDAVTQAIDNSIAKYVNGTGITLNPSPTQPPPGEGDTVAHSMPVSPSLPPAQKG